MPLSPPRRFLTIASPASAELEVRRSRFLCDVAPVPTEDAAREVIDRVRARSRDARHHCTAFVLGVDGATRRSNDDGEPSGTAGAPMLDVLTGRGLTQVVAVVTRWFGGTLLGTGGLIRAYGDAVSAALDVATTVAHERREGLVVTVASADGPRVENALHGLPGVAVTSTAWTASGLEVTVAVDPRSVDAVRGLVGSLTSGSGTVADGEESWVRVPTGRS